jgi:hypothetical protein
MFIYSPYNQGGSPSSDLSNPTSTAMFQSLAPLTWTLPLSLLGLPSFLPGPSSPLLHYCHSLFSTLSCLFIMGHSYFQSGVHMPLGDCGDKSKRSRSQL